MALATLSIDLEAKLAGLQTGLDKAARLAETRTAQIQASFDKLKGIGSSLAGVLGGAFAVGQITQFVRSTVNAVDALNDAADATGSTIEALSGLEQVALRNGGTLDDMTGILVKFNSVLKEADGKNGVSQALKAIGLDAAELRKVDPSEALQRTAEALAGFADDGNKARLVQELFGKSIREAAPLLKDLAEAGKLNATVTSEQAAQADKFNKQIFALQANAGNLGRELVLSVVPALNDMADRIRGVNSAASEAGGLGKALLAPLEAISVLGTNVAYVFRTIGKEIGGIAAQGAALARGDLGGVAEIRRSMLADAAADRAEVDRRSAQLLGIGSAQQKIPQASYSNEGRIAARTIGDLSGLGGGKKESKLKLSGADLLNSQLAGNLEKLLGKDGALGDPSDLLSMADAFGKFNSEAEWLADLIKGTPTGKLEALRSEMLRLEASFKSGSITAEQFIEIAQTRLGTLPEEVKPAIDDMTEMTKEFQRNVQDILGDGVESILKGDFDSIGKSFGDMLRKMAAQAIAADIGNLIMGKMGAGGVRGGGLFTSLLSLFGFAKGGVFSGGVQAFASGGIVGSPSLFGMAGGKMGLMGEAGPEAIMPLKRGRDGKLGVAGGGGAVTNIYNVAAGVTRNELVSALQVMAQTITGQTDAKLRRAGVQ